MSANARPERDGAPADATPQSAHPTYPWRQILDRLDTALRDSSALAEPDVLEARRALGRAIGRFASALPAPSLETENEACAVCGLDPLDRRSESEWCPVCCAAPLASSPSAEPSEPTLPDTGPLFTDEQVEALKRAAFAAHSANDRGDVFRAFCACGHSSFGSPQPLCSLLRCVRIARSRVGEAPLASGPTEGLTRTLTYAERCELSRLGHVLTGEEEGLRYGPTSIADLLHAATELRASLHAERAARAGAEQSRDEAVNWIGVVCTELVMAGYPPGDRTVALASIREILAALPHPESPPHE